MLTTKQQLNLFKIFNEAQEYDGSPTISLDVDGLGMVEVDFGNIKLTCIDATYLDGTYIIHNKVRVKGGGWVDQPDIIVGSIGQVLGLIVEVAKQYA